MNSCALFLSPAQLVVGTLPDESGAVSIHQPGSGVCIPGDGLASAGSSGALPSARLDAGGIHIQVHLALPAFDLFLGVTKFSKTKLEWRYF